MMWIIALVALGFIGLIGYRLYSHPPLSKQARDQQDYFRKRFQWAKTLIYQMDPQETQRFKAYLSQMYIHAGSGCYYGRGVMLYMETDPLQVTISVFTATEEQLVRNTWQLFQLKNQIGGMAPGTAHG
jgi:hypothetical protein